MNLTFKRMVFLSVLTVLLGFSLVYALSVEFKPRNSSQIGPTSTSTPSATIPLYEGYVLVFAYDGDNGSVGSSGFVQASITINGTEYNGTTNADLQNPLVFLLMPGQYSVIGTYGSSLQNMTVKVTSGCISDVFLNFGSSPLPPLGHVVINAWYTEQQPSGEFESQAVKASVIVTGPENHNGTTNTDLRDELIFTLEPGEYSVQVTYDSSTQSETVNVAAGSFRTLELFFGNATFPPS